MTEGRTPGSEIAARDPALYALLQRLAQTARAVFFAGLPGTGKSLLVQQLARLAHSAQRRVHLLQWDVVRPAIEYSPAAAAYPQVEGVTHAAVRIAAGLWARDAVARWAAGSAPEHILIGETPLVGHRFIELARVEADEAESFLSGAASRFLIPVPSVEVRRAIEAERARRIERPVHHREKEDAPPSVLRAQWEALAAAAPLVGATPPAPAPGGVRVETSPPPYNPDFYEAVYRHLLRHRRAQTVPLHALLPVAAASVYDFGVPIRELVPTPEEAAASIRLVKKRFPDSRTLQAAADGWYMY